MQVRAHRLDELELLLTLLSVLGAFLAPQISLPAFRFTMRHLRRAARRPGWAMAFVAALPLLLRAALLAWMPAPQPQIQEEFSYLLGADTFAHGRLANPTHPMAVFFDNMQLIQTPHYASARLPGQAAFLGAGEAMFHSPWMGVYLSVGLMCAAFYWMLRGWAPPVWALLAALLFAIRFGVFTYWMNSYWGGSVIALGGALVLGALARILRRPRMRDALLYALGCCLLASNRPYEGFFFVLPTVAVLGFHWRKAGSETRARLLLLGSAAIFIVAVYLGWFAFYNDATTGSPFQTAYGLWRQQQSVVPAFWWQPLRRTLPVYYSAQTYQFNAVWEVGIYRALHRSIAAGMEEMGWRLMQFLRLYLRPLLLLPMLAAVAGASSRRGRKHAGLRNGLWVAAGLLAAFLGHSLVFTSIFLVGGVFLLMQGEVSPRLRLPIAVLLAGAASAMLTNFNMPTYESPFTAAALILVAAGLESIAAWRRRRGTGAALALNLSFCCGLMFLVSTAFSIFHVHVTHEAPFYWSTYENELADRAAVESFLERQPGQQLAIVRYGAGHDVLKEWVWNLADIDAQKVVWAREQKPGWTAQLVKYYRGRTIWLVEPEAGRVVPYPVGDLSSSGEPLPLPGSGK
jgi:hypothetical protein